MKIKDTKEKHATFYVKVYLGHGIYLQVFTKKSMVTKNTITLLLKKG